MEQLKHAEFWWQLCPVNDAMASKNKYKLRNCTSFTAIRRVSKAMLVSPKNFLPVMLEIQTRQMTMMSQQTDKGYVNFNLF